MQQTFDDFLPIPSLSTTSSAQRTRCDSSGSARRRKVAEGVEGPAGVSVAVIVWEPEVEARVEVRRALGICDWFDMVI